MVSRTSATIALPRRPQVATPKTKSKLKASASKQAGENKDVRGALATLSAVINDAESLCQQAGNLYLVWQAALPSQRPTHARRHAVCGLSLAGVQSSREISRFCVRASVRPTQRCQRAAVMESPRKATTEATRAWVPGMLNAGMAGATTLKHKASRWLVGSPEEPGEPAFLLPGRCRRDAHQGLNAGRTNPLTHQPRWCFGPGAPEGAASRRVRQIAGSNCRGYTKCGAIRLKVLFPG